MTMWCQRVVDLVIASVALWPVLHCAAQIPTCTCDSGSFTSSQKAAVLSMHNKLRQVNGLGPLTWDCSFECSAQDWVDKVDRHGGCPGSNCHSHTNIGHVRDPNLNFENVFGVGSSGPFADPAFLTFKWFMEWTTCPEPDGCSMNHFLGLSLPCLTKIGCGFRSPGLFVCQYAAEPCNAPLVRNFSGCMADYLKGGFMEAEVQELYAKLQTPPCEDRSDGCVNVFENIPKAVSLLDSCKAPTPGVSYDVHNGPGNDHCAGTGMISESSSLGKADCEARCSADPACKFISLWASGGVNWCRLNSACDVLGQQSWHTISIYQKRSTPTSPYELHTGPGSDHCAEAGMISESSSSGKGDCESRCTADPACKFISLWASGGVNWCRLNSACDVLGQQSWHTISIYRKPATRRLLKQAPPPSPATAKGMDSSLRR